MPFFQILRPQGVHPEISVKMHISIVPVHRLCGKITGRTRLTGRKPAVRPGKSLFVILAQQIIVFMGYQNFLTRDEHILCLRHPAPLQQAVEISIPVELFRNTPKAVSRCRFIPHILRRPKFQMNVILLVRSRITGQLCKQFPGIRVLYPFFPGKICRKIRCIRQRKLIHARLTVILGDVFFQVIAVFRHAVTGIDRVAGNSVNWGIKTQVLLFNTNLPCVQAGVHHTAVGCANPRTDQRFCIFSFYLPNENIPIVATLADRSPACPGNPSCKLDGCDLSHVL